MSAIPRSLLRSRVVELLNTTKFVSMKCLTSEMGVDAHYLGGSLRPWVASGHLVSEVHPANDGTGHLTAFYRLPTKKEKLERAIVSPESMSIVWNDPFALGGRA